MAMIEEEDEWDNNTEQLGEHERWCYRGELLYCPYFYDSPVQEWVSLRSHQQRGHEGHHDPVDTSWLPMRAVKTNIRTLEKCCMGVELDGLHREKQQTIAVHSGTQPPLLPAHVETEMCGEEDRSVSPKKKTLTFQKTWMVPPFPHYMKKECISTLACVEVDGLER